MDTVIANMVMVNLGVVDLIMKVDMVMVNLGVVDLIMKVGMVMVNLGVVDLIMKVDMVMVNSGVVDLIMKVDMVMVNLGAWSWSSDITTHTNTLSTFFYSMEGGLLGIWACQAQKWSVLPIQSIQ
jgi:hypothetical protein